MLNLRGRLGNQIMQLSYYLDRCNRKAIIVNESSVDLDVIFSEMNIITVKNRPLDLLFKRLRKIKSVLFNQYLDLFFFGIYDGYCQHMNELNPNLKSYLNERIVDTIKAEIVIHVRGEDYLSKKNRKIYNLVDSSFYIKILKDHIKPLRQKSVFLVGNDKVQLEKLKIELESYFETVYFEIFTGLNYWEDFSFLANAETAIIPNSTFSYCARLLNSKTTYCVDQWYLSTYYKRPNNNSINFI
tara:strand:- start:8526 stop:9251 length:726 start_codon:yes stop_codon:yes gene_type:complete